MSDVVKISALPTATSVGIDDYVPIVQSGVTKKTSSKLIAPIRVSDENSIAYYSMDDSASEYPDGTPVYFQDAWSTVDGWMANANGPLTIVTPGYLRVATNQTYAYKAIGSDGNLFRVKVKAVTGGASCVLLTAPLFAAIAASPVLAAGETAIIEGILPAGVTAIYVGKSLYAWDIDWVYVGDGSYATLLSDDSGNGITGTMVATLPVAGVSGKALQFNGLSSKVTIAGASSYFGINKVLSISLWIKPLSATNGYVFSYPDTINNNRFYLTILNATTVQAIINTGTTISIPCATNERAHIVIVRDNITGAFLAYKNGALVSSTTSTKPTTETATSLYLGTLSGSGSYGNVIIDELHIDNKVLSDSEVYSRYLFKDSSKASPTALPPIPDTLPIRDSLGNIQANGFKFPGTQVASSDANTLDDYEEGSFTPGISFGGASVGATYGVRVGKYTKIGNRVLFNISIVLTAKGSSSGSALITGLPFTSSSDANTHTAVYVRPKGITFADAIFGFNFPGSTTIGLSESTNAGLVTDISSTDFVDTSEIMVAGQYYV